MTVELWDEAIESALAAVAILAITYLGLHGITNGAVVTAIVALGGAKSYRKYKEFKNGGGT